MAAELIVIGPTTGAAYTYARQRFGAEAPERCFVPVAPFSLVQFAHGHRKAAMPRAVVLAGTMSKADWPAWESALKAAKVTDVTELDK